MRADISSVYAFLADYINYSKLCRYIEEVRDISIGDQAGAYVRLGYMSTTLCYECDIILRPGTIEILGRPGFDIEHLYAMWSLGSLSEKVTRVCYQLECNFSSAVKNLFAAGLAKIYVNDLKYGFCDHITKALSADRCRINAVR